MKVAIRAPREGIHVCILSKHVSSGMRTGQRSSHLLVQALRRACPRGSQVEDGKLKLSLQYAIVIKIV